MQPSSYAPWSFFFLFHTYTCIPGYNLWPILVKRKIDSQDSSLTRIYCPRCTLFKEDRSWADLASACHFLFYADTYRRRHVISRPTRAFGLSKFSVQRSALSPRASRTAVFPSHFLHHIGLSCFFFHPTPVAHTSPTTPYTYSTREDPKFQRSRRDIKAKCCAGPANEASEGLGRCRRSISFWSRTSIAGKSSQSFSRLSALS